MLQFQYKLCSLICCISLVLLAQLQTDVPQR